MDNNIDGKKADNRISDEVIVAKKRKEFDELNDIREDFEYINRELEKCIDLLDESMKKENNNRDLDALRRDNMKTMSNILWELEKSKLEIEKKYKNNKEE